MDTVRSESMTVVASPGLRMQRFRWGLLAVAVGLVVAGFWNPRLVDGFGRDVVMGETLGDSRELAGAFSVRGLGFGFLFAGMAGLAATFTACNCVVFAMLPGLACATGPSRSRLAAFKPLGVFIGAVWLVSASYGAFVGLLGTSGIGPYLDTRGPRAQIVFSVIGLVMLLWGIADLSQAPQETLIGRARVWLSPVNRRAGVMGVLVGLFGVGRPFPVMRDLLAYAASAESPLYGAVVMGIEGLGQITVMLLLLMVVVYLFRGPLTRWATNSPEGVTVATALALLGGGSYFLCYWGILRLLGMGGWGFRLGLYS